MLCAQNTHLDPFTSARHPEDEDLHALPCLIIGLTPAETTATTKPSILANRKQRGIHWGMVSPYHASSAIGREVDTRRDLVERSQDFLHRLRSVIRIGRDKTHLDRNLIAEKTVGGPR